MVGELLGNERFMTALETVLSTKGYLERRVRTILNTMSVASRLDVEELGSKLADLDRKLRQATKRLEAMQTRLDEANAKLEALGSTVAIPVGTSEAAALGRHKAGASAAPAAAQHRLAGAEDRISPGPADAGRSAEPPAGLPGDGAERTEGRSPAAASGATGGPAMEAVCGVCGKSFQKKTYNQRYCSAACRSAA
jgi:hypothetical protein